MKTWDFFSRRTGCGWINHFGLLVVIAALQLPAYAALGGTLDSVQTDQARMLAHLKVSQATAYEVHEITAPNGTVVREYVSPDGRVFGVAWQGPFVPDLQLILGSYFAQFSDAARKQQRNNFGRRPLNIQEPGLVVQTAGHMRAYSGRAYDPTLLPSGVAANDLW